MNRGIHQDTNPYDAGCAEPRMLRGVVSALLLVVAVLVVGFSGAVAPDARAGWLMAGPSHASNDVNCSGFDSWEAFIPYDGAHFAVTFDADGQGANLSAQAWVNGSNAALVRIALDMLYDGLLNGNNSWISTTERDLTEITGPDCIADTPTRLGLAPGHHNGSTDWSNVSWVQDEMTLSETDMVPLSHPQARSCGFGCTEIPADHDADFQIFLKSRLDAGAVQSPGNMTLTLHGGPNSTWTITMPEREDLRVLNASPGTDVTSRPVIDEGTERLQVGFAADARVITVQFTDELLLVDDLPEWTEDAPEDGTIIPLLPRSGPRLLITAEESLDWGADDGGVATLSCGTTAAGWGLTDVDGAWWVTVSDEPTAAVTCSIMDSAGQQGLARRFTAVALDALTATPGLVNGSAEVGVPAAPAGLALAVTLDARQGQVPGDGVAGAPVSTSTAAATTVVLDTGGLAPGGFVVHLVVSGEGVWTREAAYDLGLARTNGVPLLTIDDVQWLGDGRVELSGRVSDPEAAALTFTVRVDNASGGIVEMDDSGWVTTIDLSLWGVGSHEVAVEACDPHGACQVMSVDVTLDDPSLTGAPITGGADEIADGIPAPGLLVVLVAGLLAGLVMARRQS